MDKFLEKLFIIEGILLAIVGALFFVYPIESTFMFTTVVGIFIIVSGIFTIIRGFKTDSKIFYIFSGLINILFGLIVWLSPISSIQAIILIYGIWAFVKGIYLIICSVKYKLFGFNWVTISDILLIILGLFIIFQPLVALISTPYVIGLCFIIIAIREIYVGYKM